MNRISSFLARCTISLLISATLLFAQAPETGAPPFSSTGGGPFDLVNLGDLNVQFSVPIVHKAGRGIPFNYDLTYESSIYEIATVNGHQVWQPIQSVGDVASYWGWQMLGPVVTPYVSYNSSQNTDYCYPAPNATLVPYTVYSYNGFFYHDGGGNTHPFGLNGEYISGAPENQGGDCPSNGPVPPNSQTGAAVDSSGYILTLGTPGCCGTTSGGLAFRDGTGIGAPFLTSPPSTSSPYGVTDANGNEISFSNGTYTDTLGTSVLTASGTQPSPTTFTYTSPAGSKSYTVNYSAFNLQTQFGCSVGEYSASNVYLVTSIVLPDQSEYQFSYEYTPGSTTTYTGRISQVTVPTGGTISYAYTGANDGINCSDGTTLGLQRSLTPGSGSWQYTRSGSGSAWTTTVADPTGNQTAIDFEEYSSHFYETQRLSYQGSISGNPCSQSVTTNCLLSTTIKCYNGQNVGTPSSCYNTAITAQITEATTFDYLPNASGVQRETDSKYNQYGLILEIDDYDYANGAVGSEIRKTITQYATLGNNIVDRPSSVTIEDAGNNVKGYTAYSYDQSSLAPTSGTPQHVSISGSRGNLTEVQAQVNSSTSLYRKYTYYDTGMLNTSTDVSTSSTTNGATTTYSTTSCGNSFVTSITEPVGGMMRSFTWDCNGGVLTSVKDENGNTSSTAYSGSNYTNVFWRPYSTTDQAGTITDNFYYLTTATPPVEFQTESKYHTAFNGGNSTVDQVNTIDGFGRTIFSQTRQGPGAPNYDTTATCYNSLGQVSLTTLPYSTTVATSTTACPSGNTGMAFTYDALGRTATANDNYGGGGTTSYTYTLNDVLETKNSPSLSKQTESDGVGRLKSICEITSGTSSWPSGACNQNTSATGYLTTYTYDLLGNVTGVTQNAQASSNKQTRTYVYDMLSRLTSETNPESGTTSYAYDVVNSGGCNLNLPGNLILVTDANGNGDCYGWDGLHRVLSIGQAFSSPNSAATPDHCFVYDSATVNGTSMPNAKGRLAEAYTTAQGSGCGASKTTDDGLGYDADGRPTDLYQSTPNSGGYYHTAVSYWPNSVVDTLSGYLASGSTFVPTQTYSPDGEGRWKAVAASSGPNPVSSTSYNAASEITAITYGSTDSDSFGYDNSDRMNNFTFKVNGSSEVGTPAWNPNGTLQTLAITDPFNSSNAQNCSYSYDGLARINSANCGSVWSQTFSYDPFGNITKSGTVNWQPGYNVSTNRYTLGGTSYDAKGDLTNDSFRSYAWDALGRPVTIGSKTLSYDALGRIVEKLDSGSYTQFVYNPAGGLLARMSGQSATSVRVPLPGAWALYGSGNSFNHYEHLDWLGSSRLSSTQSKTVTTDVAYAPFGEPYASSATSGVAFTGMRGDVVGAQGNTTTGVYDFSAREYPYTQGRWLSPDPAGMSASNVFDPQRWNRYAYVSNRPLAAIDPMGLDDISDPGVWLPSDCFFNITTCAADSEEAYEYCVFIGLCSGNSDSGGNGSGGAGGGPANPSSSQGGGGLWPDNETLGLPSGLNIKPLGIGDLFGLSPNLNCGDFVGCGSLGPFENGFTSGLPCQVACAEDQQLKKLFTLFATISAQIVVTAEKILPKPRIRCTYTGEFSEPSLDPNFKLCSYSCSDGQALVVACPIQLPCPPTQTK